MPEMRNSQAVFAATAHIEAPVAAYGTRRAGDWCNRCRQQTTIWPLYAMSLTVGVGLVSVTIDCNCP
jgi:hypothetical protein